MTAASLAVFAFLVAAPPVLALQGTAADQGLELEDRILAVVDEDPILVSDVDRVVRLGLARPEVGEDGEPAEEEESFRYRVLEELIEQRLRFHAVERFGFEQMPAEEVDAAVENLRQQFDEPGDLEKRMAEVGLSEDGLRQLLTRQLMVLIYIEERLGPRIFIRQEDIQAYYQDTLVPEMKASGSEVPALGDVREQIRLVLREQRLNDEIRQWTRELRRDADIRVMARPPEGALPPVVDRIEG